MTIIQPTIHTKLVVTMTSGRERVVYLAFELKSITNMTHTCIDRDHVEHYFNPAHIESIEKHFVDAGPK